MTDRKRIIFVDDEPNILHGLRRMLHPYREQWDVHFVTSGQEALRLLQQEPFDIVISDMRMPAMSGIKLLEQVREMHPGIIRIALSGQSDAKTSLNASVIAHQFLAKPCPPDILTTILTQACSLSDMVNNPQIRRVLAQMKTVPSLPALYIRLTQLLEDPNSSTEQIGQVISTDIGMSAKVMQLVNSAYFGLSDHISDPAHAVALLGINTLRSLVLSVHIFDSFSNSRISTDLVSRIWNHSLGTALGARLFIRSISADRYLLDHAYIAGLLHDIGIVILAHNFPGQYQQVLQLAIQEQIPIFQAEQKVLNLTHAEIGTYLLGIWGFPAPILQAVAYHHTPEICRPQAESPLVAVHIADVVEMHINGSWRSIPHSAADAACLSRLGFDQEFDRFDSLFRSSMEHIHQ